MDGPGAQERLGNIPPVTLAVMGLNLYFYRFPLEACLSFHDVYTYSEWSRLFLSPLHHVDHVHLLLNMVSFHQKGVWLERRMGGAWFLYLLSVFSLLSGLVYILLQAGLTKLDDSKLLEGFIDLSSHSNERVVGFSGVLFALAVVSNNPGGLTAMFNLPVHNHHAIWVEMLLIYLSCPGTSLIGHLSGILVGRLYIVGPLETIMKICAVFTNCRSGFQEEA